MKEYIFKYTKEELGVRAYRKVANTLQAHDIEILDDRFRQTLLVSGKPQDISEAKQELTDWIAVPNSTTKIPTVKKKISRV